MPGVTAMETSVAVTELTVIVVEPLIVPDVALIVAVPAPALVAKPPDAIVATEALDELHTAVLVRFCVVPSLNVPVAVNCCVAPSAIEGFAGVTAIDCSVAAVTVNRVEPVTLPSMAATVTVPFATEVANPCVGAELLIVATVPVPALQCTDCVTFCVLPSLNVPVAVYCCVAPLGIDAEPGVTLMDDTVTDPTAITVFPLMAPEVAVIVVEPFAMPVANP